jgi:hypothetical protein
MSEGVTGICQPLCAQNHVSTKRCATRTRRPDFRAAAPLILTSKNSPTAPWKMVKGSRYACRARKEKALGPCELRALLRDEPSSPCTRHGRRHITWHRQTLRSDNASYCSGARPSAQPKSLARRDRNFRSLQGAGRKDPLPESLPPKNRACDFHRTRLTHNKSFLHGSRLHHL